jgi:hypothetical protein
MSVSVLVSGALFRAPEARKSSTGKRYIKASLRVAGADNSPPEFWDLLCFSETAGAELMRLGDGDRLAAQGNLKIDLYQPEGKSPRIQRTVFVDSVLPLRSKPKERKQKTAPPAQAAPPDRVNIVPPADQSAAPFDDDIPF